MNETADDRVAIDLRETVPGSRSGSIDARPPCSSLEIGRVLRGRYVLEKRLGGGGSSIVFKALDRYRADLPGVRQHVAIKVFQATGHNGGSLARLRQQFYCTQMLSHRNIVNVFELDRDGDVDFFTMELLEGELLSAVMDRFHPLPMARSQAWAIIRDIGSALEHAHARNVVHSDLKPHNIMLTQSGEVRMLDFGAASAAATPAYASCELLEGRTADPRDDIYALACISYELLAGSHPFQRRRSTEARDLRVVPQRPAELGRQQWQALSIGLSWHRGGRSITVGDWLKKVNIHRVAAEQLPSGRDLKAGPAVRRPVAPFKATALFAVLLLTATFWVSLAHWVPAGKLGDNTPVSTLAAGGQPPSSSATPIAASMVRTISPSAAVDVMSTSPQPQLPAKSDAGRIGGRAKSTASTGPAAIHANNYRVHSGENFAEIRVHRNTPSASGSPFLWWTEAASAKTGVDYVAQTKATQIFPKGKHWTSIFVKLLPNSARAQPEVFYVAISEAGHASRSDHIARAEVWLPPVVEQPPSVAARVNTETAGTTGRVLRQASVAP
jgi:serine/threonine protein kinase